MIRSVEMMQKCYAKWSGKASRLLVLLLLLIISSTGISYAATYTVDTTINELDGSCIDGDCSLRDAVALAGNGDIVQITSAGTYLGNITISNNITLTSTVGTSVILSGATASTPVITINSTSTATIDSITVNNSQHSTGTSYGIHITGTSAPTIQDSIITDNVSTLNSGAGIVIDSTSTSTVTISNVTSSSNSSKYHGPGIYINGASTPVDITGSTITGNTGAETKGSGISAVNATGTITITNSDIHTNTTTAGMGAVLCDNCSDMQLVNTDIYNNTNSSSFSTNRGAGLAVVSGGSVTMTGGNIYKNTHSSRAGGGVYVSDSGSTFDANECRIEGNKAVDTGGGGVYIASSGTATITNCFITGNVADVGTFANGGGIYNNGGTLNLYHSTVAGNYAKKWGGGVITNNTTSTVDSNIIWDNTAAGGQNDYYAYAGTSTITYSAIKGGSYTAGTGVITSITGTVFVNPIAASTTPRNSVDDSVDYHLKTDATEAINSANPSPSPANSQDFDGDSRPQGGGYEMGADEHNAETAPTATYTSGVYTPSTNTLVFTGTNFDTIAAVSTDVKSYMDWTKFSWDINGDNATSTNISVAEADVTSLTVTNATTLTLVFTDTKADDTIEDFAGIGMAYGDDTLDITAGFSRAVGGTPATTDALADGTLTITDNTSFEVTKIADTQDANGCTLSDCSLREAIDAANADSSATPGAPHIINIPANASPYAITLTGIEANNATGDFDVKEDIRLIGAGAGSTTISGQTGGGDYVFQLGTGYTITLEEMKVTHNGNDSSQGTGGCLYSDSNLTIKNATFDSCTATNGGAVYVTDGNTLTLDNTTFTSNVATSDTGGGGAVRANGLTIQNGSTFQNNSTSGKGGAIYNVTNDITINGTVLFDNNDTAKGSNDRGGAIYTTGNLTLNDTSGATTFQNNDALCGGAINVDDAAKTITAYGSIFTSNTTTNHGGALCIYGGDLNDVSFTNNSTNNYGGAIYSLTNDLTINGTNSFTNNDTTKAASDNGGAIYATGNININVTSGSSTFTNNDAYCGGAININASGKTLTAKNSTFTTNTAANIGGALCIQGGTLSDVSFTSNSSTNQGGAIYNINNALTVNGTSNTFESNSSSSDVGGAISSPSGAVDVTNTTFNLNTAAGNGGAISANNGSSCCTVTATDSTFTSNQATAGNGGAINARSGITLTDTTLDGNTASVSGGGAFAAAGGATLTRVTISSNTATTGDGGGLWAANGVNAYNSTISGNTANASGKLGGGIYQSTAGGTCSFINTTFYNNSANSNGSSLRGGEACTMKNVLMTSNGTAKNCRYNTHTVTTSKEYHSTQAASCNFGALDSGLNVDTLKDNGGTTKTHALLTGSTAIDNGDSTTCAAAPISGADQRGTVHSGTCDIGSYEYITANNAPIGGYTASNVIPTAQVTQSSNGDGIITIQFRAQDAETENVTLNTFEYSVDGGSGWNAPTNADASASLSTNWDDNGGGGYSSAVDWTGTVHSFTFDTNHADTAGMAGVDQSDVQVRFTLNDGTDDSAAPVTSESFQVDNVAPTSTITSSSYNPGADTLTITGTNFTTIADAATDIKSYVDWSKFVWDINGDNATTANISFVVGDVFSLTVTDATTLTLVFTGAKGTAIEATAGYGSSGGADTLDVTAGFSKDAAGNAATTDAVADAALSIAIPSYIVTKTADTNDGTCDTDCSLREAVAAANAASDTNTISFNVIGTFTLTGSAGEDSNASGDLDVVYPVTIAGDGIANTIISGNNADRIFHFQATATGSQIDDVKLINGEAGTLNGGCVYSPVSLTITGTAMDNCKAQDAGGALYTTGATLTDVTIDNSYSDGTGGAVHNTTGTLTINGTSNTFSGNYVVDGTTTADVGGHIYSNADLAVQNASFTGRGGTNLDAHWGGGIYMAAGTLTVSDSTFDQFYANNQGGAIYARGGTLSDITITNSKSNAFGAAIVNTASSLTINGTSNTFTNNYSLDGTETTDLGGHIYSDADLAVQNASFTGRGGTDLDAYRGGAIYMTAGSSLTVSDSTFDQFYVDSQGGAIFARGGTLSDITITNSKSNARAGAVLNTDNLLTINGTSNTFTNNYTLDGTATSDLGGHINSNAALVVQNATFTGQGGANLDAYRGGAIYMTTGSSLTVSDSTFDQFFAGNQGGAIYARGGTLSDITITNSKANAYGGAIANVDAALIINGTSNTFTGNYVVDGTLTSDLGGSIYSGNALSISNADFDGRSGSADHDAYRGGAVYITGTGALTISDSTFDDFETNTGGGAIYIVTSGTSTLSDVSFTNNHSNNGAAGAIGSTGGPLIIQGSSNSFVGNAAGIGTNDNGGAIWTNSNLTVSNTTFDGNTGFHAGAIYSQGTITVTVKQSLFTNNATTGGSSNGGGIYGNDAGTTIYVANSTFSGNTAVNLGAAISTNSTTCTVRSSTFYDNDGGGTQDVIAGSNCVIYGSIVRNITASTAMCNGSSGGYNIQYSSAGTGTCFTNSTGDTTQDPDINTTLAANGGPTQTHALNATSPAINNGDNTQCSHADVNDEDQRGETRPLGATCDIGAYEATPAAVAISGTVYTDEGATTIADGATVRLIINGVSAGTDTTATGAYSITATPNAGDVMIVYVDGHASDGTTVTVSDSNALAGLDIYADHLITRHDNGGSLTNANMTTALGAYSDAEILYTTDGSDNLTVSGGATELFIWTGDTYAPGATIDTVHMDVVGTLNGAANAINVSGNWDVDAAGVFTSTGTVTFDAASGTNTITSGGTDADHDFQNITFNDAAGTATFQLAGAIDVDGNFTATDGIVDTTGSNYAITVGGNLSQAAAGQIEANGSTITVTGNIDLDGTVDSTDYNSATLVTAGAASDITFSNLSQPWNNGVNNLTVGPGGVTDTIDTSMAIQNDLTIGTGELSGAVTLYMRGNTDIFIFDAASNLSLTNMILLANAVNLPTLTNEYGTNITLGAVGPQTVTQTGAVTLSSGKHLRINGDGVTTRQNVFDTGGYALTVGGDIIIGAGSDTGAKDLTANGSTISVAGNFTVNSGANTFTKGTSTVVLNGAADQTVTTGAQAFNNVTLNNTGTNGSADDVIISGTLDIDGILTITDGDLDISTNDPTINSAGNVSVGASGSFDVSSRTANWTFDGTSILTDSSAGQDFEDVVVNGTSLTLGSNAKVQTMTVTAGTLDLGSSSYVLEIDGTGTPLSNSGTFTAGTSTVKYTGTTTATNITNLAYSSLQLTPGGATTYSLMGHQTGGNAITGHVTIDANATLTTTGSNYNIALAGDWNNSGSFTAGTGTVTLNGTSQAINGSTVFYNLTKSVAAADTLTIEATKTITIASGGTVTLNGASGQLLTLASSTGSSAWDFVLTDATVTKAIDYVSVSWSDASGSHATQKPIAPTNSTDGGNTTDWFASGSPTITVTKLSVVISDPINGGSSPKRIPGAVVEYSVIPSNSGDASPDANSVYITDPIDTTLIEFYATGGVSFTDGTTSSALALDAVTYSDEAAPGPYTYDYTPVPDGDGYDSSITSIKVTTTGTFAFGGAPDPSFTLKFRVRIK